MALLDTFYVMFNADTKGVEDGLKKTDAAAQSISDNVLKSNRNLTGLIGKSLSALAISATLKGIADFAAEMYRSSEALDVGVERLSVWIGLAETAGVEAETFKSSLDKMAIATGKTFGQVLDELPLLAEHFKNLNRVQSLKLGEKLGIHASTVALLRKGGDNLEYLLKQQQKLGGVSKESAKSLTDFQQSVNFFSQGLKVLGVEIAGNVAPLVQAFFDTFSKGIVYLRQYPNLIEGISYALYGLSAILTIVAVKAALAFLPFNIGAGLILALGSAALIAYDDFKTFLEGGSSLIGRFLNKFPLLLDFFKGLASVFKEINGLLNDVHDNMQSGVARMHADDLNLGNGNSEIKREGIPSIYDRRKSYKELLTQDAPFFAVPTQSQLTESFRSESNSNSKSISNVTNVDTLTVNTQATDGEQLLRDINTELERQNRQAQANFEDGIAY